MKGRSLIVDVVDITVIIDHCKVTYPLMKFVNLLTQIELFQIRSATLYTDYSVIPQYWFLTPLYSYIYFYYHDEKLL